MGKSSLFEPVDIQNSVKMVGFVLENDCCEAGDGVSDCWQGCGSEMAVELAGRRLRFQRVKSGQIGVFYNDFLTSKHFASTTGY